MPHFDLTNFHLAPNLAELDLFLLKPCAEKSEIFFYNEWWENNCLLHPEQIHFMRASWLQFLYLYLFIDSNWKHQSNPPAVKFEQCLTKLRRKVKNILWVAISAYKLWFWPPKCMLPTQGCMLLPPVLWNLQYLFGLLDQV